ncbi:MAG TPA: exodeoxyribonuclease VII small subunit [Candidatus Eremiobacteraceae bacterium]|nr:exodeoxyribonuclease VII small subunit [Candidatus Eremiobacteraceae bacterium]
MAKTTGKKKAEDGSEDELNFEQSLARLEQIVESLDDGNLPLEKSLALFKEGTKLARNCRELLAEAEVQVKDALRDVESTRASAEEEE